MLTLGIRRGLQRLACRFSVIRRCDVELSQQSLNCLAGDLERVSLRIEDPFIAVLGRDLPRCFLESSQ